MASAMLITSCGGESEKKESKTTEKKEEKKQYTDFDLDNFEENGKYGVQVVEDGKVLILAQAQYDYIDRYNNGAAIFGIGEFGNYGKNISGKMGVLGLDGKEIIPAKYDFINKFNENGIALVANGTPDNYGVKDGKYGFINLKGEEIVPLEYDHVEQSIAEGSWAEEKREIWKNYN